MRSRRGRGGGRNMSQKERRMTIICKLFNPDIETSVDNVLQTQDEVIKTAVRKVFETQTEIKRAKEEKRKLKLTLKVNAIVSRKPLYDKRNTFIKKIPQFWKNIFLNHPQLEGFLTDDDKEILDSLSSVEVGQHKHGKPGFTFSFGFGCNDYFKSKKVEKSYTVLKRKTIIEVSDLKWTRSLKKDGRKRSFFSWLTNTKGDPGTDLDQFADIIIEL